MLLNRLKPNKNGYEIRCPKRSNMHETRIVAPTTKSNVPIFVVYSNKRQYIWSYKRPRSMNHIPNTQQESGINMLIKDISTPSLIIASLVTFNIKHPTTKNKIDLMSVEHLL